jgi:hypothetical protein
MIAATTSDVTTTRWRIAARSVTCLPAGDRQPNGPFQHAKRSIIMIVGGLKSSTSRRRYLKDSREVKLIHTKPP